MERNRIISKTVHDCPDSEPVQQQFRDPTKISNILSKYGMGILQNKTVPKFQVDSSMSTETLHDALIMIQSAKESFDQLPVEVRKRFNNDPAELLKFVHDPKNQHEAESLGLVEIDPEKKFFTNLEIAVKKETPKEAPKGESEESAVKKS